MALAMQRNITFLSPNETSRGEGVQIVNFNCFNLFHCAFYNFYTTQ